MLVNIRIASLWTGDDRLVSVKTNNGTERLEIVTPESA